MAIEMYPAATPTPPTTSSTTDQNRPPSRGMSPRISFSHDLNQSDVVPVEPHLPLNPSSLFASANFNFYYPNNHPIDQQQFHSSSADELFSNGVLLPLQNINSRRENPPPTTTQTHDPTTPTLPSDLPLPPPINDNEGPKEGERSEKRAQQQQGTKSFWKFKRSRSFNCGSIYRGTLCPLPLLSRSKSTGSNSSVKRSLVPKDQEHGYHHHHHHHNNNNNNSSSHQNRNLGTHGNSKQRSSSVPYSSSSSSSYSGYTHQKKPPLRKSFGSAGGSNAVVVSPVLNVPSANLFGIGSIFCSIGRGAADKGNSKKKMGI